MHACLIVRLSFKVSCFLIASVGVAAGKRTCCSCNALTAWQRSLNELEWPHLHPSRPFLSWHLSLIWGLAHCQLPIYYGNVVASHEKQHMSALEVAQIHVLCRAAPWRAAFALSVPIVVYIMHEIAAQSGKAIVSACSWPLSPGAAAGEGNGRSLLPASL